MPEVRRFCAANQLAELITPRSYTAAVVLNLFGGKNPFRVFRRCIVRFTSIPLTMNGPNIRRIILFTGNLSVLIRFDEQRIEDAMVVHRIVGDQGNKWILFQASLPDSVSDYQVSFVCGKVVVRLLNKMPSYFPPQHTASHRGERCSARSAEAVTAPVGKVKINFPTGDLERNPRISHGNAATTSGVFLPHYPSPASLYTPVQHRPPSRAESLWCARAP